MSNWPRFLLLLGSMCAVLLAAPELRAQYVQSANNSADYRTTIAQGSLFVIFGGALGPVNLVQVSAFPLQNNLAGTSVTVTSGSTTLNCPMIYSSSGQVAAILPSNTPLGPAIINVLLSGTNIPPGTLTTQITVVPTLVGLYTTTSTGLGAGIFTDALSGTLKTPANAATPGELVFVWGTGIGPINAPDNEPPPILNFPNVQVWVGGQAAQVYYAGRSGCYSGVDETAFYVPAGVSGCNVPVTLVSGGVSSNTVTMPIGASAGPCTDTGPTLPASVLTKAVAGQPVRLAEIVIGPSAIQGLGAEPRAVARSLSAALGTKVSEADAARLIRAYRSHSSRAVRMAMAKYASRWKALDAQTKARLTARMSLAQEGATAIFGTFSSESLMATIMSAQFPTSGACLILPGQFPYGLGAASQGLDAGASLSLTGTAGAYTLKESSKGVYQVVFGPSIVGPDVPPGAYTIAGTGGKDVGAFSTTATVASRLAISNKSALASVNRTIPLTVTWTGGVAGNYFLIGGGSIDSYFACAGDAGAGTFTIPAYILSSINATTGASGFLWISPNPLSNQIAIPGIDLAYFTDASSDSVSVAFQ
jgi:uncharacterized protein (TIGR03437 family)